jgi:protein-disulfide isomerase
VSGTRLTPPVGERDHVSGPAGAPVTLVEYGDFECPYCGMAYPIVKAAQRRLGARLRFAYRYFPLREAHPHAQHAAEAAEAAAAQGKFWAMHDALFDDRSALDDAALSARARRIGLDVARFEAELADGVHAPRVREDFRSGVRSGVNRTPTFFVNGVRYDGAWADESGFIRFLRSAADAAAEPLGTPRADGQ